jgi:hypothetical protein
MTINLIRGTRRKNPNQGDEWVSYEPTGNTIIEFVHPTESEKKILHDVQQAIAEYIRDRYLLEET